MPKLPFGLPDGYTPIVKEGDAVTAGQIIAQAQASTEESVNIPEQLGVPLKSAGKYIKLIPGEQITEGDVIAVKKNLFGKTQAIIISEINGTLLRYERDTGNLIVRNDDGGEKGDIISPVEGHVEVCNNKEIVIRTDRGLGGSRVVSGTKSEGEIFVLEESFLENAGGNMLFYLDSRAIGKIVLGTKFNRDVFIKGVGIGAAGFLVESVLDEDIEYLREKNISMPVMEIDSEAIQTLKLKNGHKVVVNAQARTILFL